jgi:hypothetical protein
MALIQCRECGKNVSDEAPACPHCGVPMSVAVTPVTEQSSKRVTQGASGCLIVIVLGALAIWLAGRSNDDRPAAESAAPAAPTIATVPVSEHAREGDGWEQIGEQGSMRFVALTGADVSEDLVRNAIAAVCKVDTFCNVAVWQGEASAATSLPMTDAQVATQLAHWSYNGNTGNRELFWDCKRLPQHDRNDCL